MARMARVVALGVPHYVTQRTNRRQEIFFSDEDCRGYLEVMAQWCSLCAVEVWAYCLMANHVHLIFVPESKEAMTRAIGEAPQALYQGAISGKGARGTCGKLYLPPFPWMSALCWLQRDILS